MMTLLTPSVCMHCVSVWREKFTKEKSGSINIRVIAPFKGASLHYHNEISIKINVFLFLPAFFKESLRSAFFMRVKLYTTTPRTSSRPSQSKALSQLLLIQKCFVCRVAMLTKCLWCATNESRLEKV